MQLYYYYSTTTGTGKLITDESEGLFVVEKTHVQYHYYYLHYQYYY
jgi:hypothetical protein